MKENNKISKFQFATITYFILNGLFKGLGIVNIFEISKQDSWIAVILALVISILPLIIFIFILNYQPSKNIFEKMTYLFGKIFGNFINFLLIIFVLTMLVLTISTTSSFANTMYLTKTPAIIIMGMFIAIAIYSVIKGIETISRMSEVLFFFALFIIAIIFSTLYTNFHFHELKPILVRGFSPVLSSSLLFLSYSLTPLLTLTAIPKSDIVYNKKYHWYFLGAILYAFIHLFHVFFLIPGVVTIKIAELYRFPAYYVLRKSNIGTIDNIENIISVHWFFNTFMLIVMCIYFFKVYSNTTLKLKKEKISNIIIILLGLLVIILPQFVFKNPLTNIRFIKNQFPLFVSALLLFIFIITSIFILFKRKNEKK